MPLRPTNRAEIRRPSGERVMLNYRIFARRADSHGGIATAKSAQVVLDTDMAGRDDAMSRAAA